MSWEEKGRMSAGVDEERIMGIDMFTVHCACWKLSKIKMNLQCLKREREEEKHSI